MIKISCETNDSGAVGEKKLNTEGKPGMLDEVEIELDSIKKANA